MQQQFSAQLQKVHLSAVPFLLANCRTGETGHAMGHLEFLEEVGDPATDEVRVLVLVSM